MELAFSFLITITVEILVMLFFYKRKTRPYAVLIAFILNLFTWPLLHVFLYNTSIDANILMAGVTILEAFGYWLFLRCNIGKGLLISVIGNALSYGLILLIFKHV